LCIDCGGVISQTSGGEVDVQHRGVAPTWVLAPPPVLVGVVVGRRMCAGMRWRAEGTEWAEKNRWRRTVEDQRGLIDVKVNRRGVWRCMSCI
jgi:hypothetical protein